MSWMVIVLWEKKVIGNRVYFLGDEQMTIFFIIIAPFLLKGKYLLFYLLSHIISSLNQETMAYTNSANIYGVFTMY